MDWSKYKIPIIKAVRQITSLGLKEAKEVVDAWLNDYEGAGGDYRNSVIARLEMEKIALKTELREKDQTIQDLAAGIKKLLEDQ